MEARELYEIAPSLGISPEERDQYRRSRLSNWRSAWISVFEC